MVISHNVLISKASNYLTDLHETWHVNYIIEVHSSPIHFNFLKKQ
jgi:hypothetical protein